MTYIVWVVFLVFVLVMVLLDLGVFHRKAHTPRLREAVTWTLIWIGMAMIFNVVVYFLYEQHWGGWSGGTLTGTGPSEILNGREAALQFFTGYVLEKSLSVDNIFVIALIFSYFSVPPSHQHRLLFWGILGAVVLRGVMIIGGAALVERFEWIIYVFGVLLLVSAAKMLFTKHDTMDPDKNFMVRLVRRWYPVSNQYEGGKFFVKVDGKRAVTPMFLALVLIETSDVMFAIDSIPAIFAVTRDPFLVFTSNIFAILGLRSLYFVLAGFLDRFHYLKLSLVLVLAFVGVKMLLSGIYHIPNLVSLSVIAGILVVGVVASMIKNRRDLREAPNPPLPEKIEEEKKEMVGK